MANNLNNYEHLKPGPPKAAAHEPIYCYICGRQFGSKSIGIHQPQCLKKWKIQNDQLPKDVRPDNSIDVNATNMAAYEASLAQLIRCENCGRKLAPERLQAHQRACTKEHPGVPIIVHPGQHHRQPHLATTHLSDATKQKFLGGAHGNDVDNLDAPKQHNLGGVGGDKQLKPEDARPRSMRGAWPWIPPRNATKFLGGANVETVVAKPEDARPRRGAWPWIPPRNATKFLGGANVETVVAKPEDARPRSMRGAWPWIPPRNATKFLGGAEVETVVAKPEDSRPRRGAWPWIPPRNATKFLGGAEVETVVAKPEDARPRRGAWPWIPPRNATNRQEQRKFLGGAEDETGWPNGKVPGLEENSENSSAEQRLKQW
ncbi:hypothetical protein niasHT_015141 [Heterodera trifolii]|uniref:C2HC/C3H-type domain-containing protein n=1 Tax=Heterodera trifolii TaxID=157864 RepID=A0ABD2L9X7_9BILA